MPTQRHFLRAQFAPAVVAPGSTQTSEIGTTWVPLPDVAATSVIIENDSTATAFEWRYVSTPVVTFSLYNNTSDLIEGITNLSQIEFRRKDVSNTPALLKWRAKG